MFCEKLTSLKYSEILERNAALHKHLQGASYEIQVLSNIIVTQINEILEYSLRAEHIPAIVQCGDYDNIVQDSFKYKNARCLIIFMELCNVIDRLPSEIELFDHRQMEELFNKVTSEIDLVFANTKDVSLVLFNQFSAMTFSYTQLTDRPLDHLAARLNEYLDKNKPQNVQLVNIEKVIARIGVPSSIDMRYFYSSRALYTVAFFKEYVEYISPYLLSVNGKAKKAIIFDCDGTLWQGVLGEEGTEGVDMSADSKTGSIFSEIQNIALSWHKQGVLIGLCSKNNVEDVDEMIKSHPHMKLRNEHIVIKRINWQDKVTNLKGIARELGIGLDGLVFVDDSPFEIELIKEQLPQVKVLQVPKDLSEYPRMLRDQSKLFYGISQSKEDLMKTKFYKDNAERDSFRSKFSSIEEYLASLEIKVEMKVDDLSSIPRFAQLTQKTNQFNLTTQRYTENDIKNFIEEEGSLVFSFSVQDKFGDSGIVGMSIVVLSKNSTCAYIDTFLMSCRVIGRNIEFAVMDYLMSFLKSRGVVTVNAKYIKTAKNAQVVDFYDRCSFSYQQKGENETTYLLKLEEYVPKQLNYLEVKDGK